MANQVLDLLYKAFQEKSEQIDGYHFDNEVYNPEGNANIVSSLIDQNYIDCVMKARRNIS